MRSQERVEAALRQLGLELEVVELPQSTRTAQEAAEAVGCSVSQIAKSLVFRGEATNRAYLVITSGTNRVATERLASHVGEPIAMAKPDFVRQETGFSIGGVAPIGLTSEIGVLIDEDLLSHEFIWAAAGTPRSVFRLTPDELRLVAGDDVVRVADIQ